MRKKSLFSVSLSAFCLLLNTGSAKENAIFPQFLDKMPTYMVKAIPSPGLPQANLQLTDRALRVLPSYFIYAHKLKPWQAKIAPSLNRIRIEQLEKEPFCSDDLNMCWPKSIEAVGQYLVLTPHEGDPVYYLDSQKLGTFLWDELRTPLKSMVKNKK